VNDVVRAGSRAAVAAATSARAAIFSSDPAGMAIDGVCSQLLLAVEDVTLSRS